MSRTSLNVLGGANFIGSSAYVFNFNGLRIGVDRGSSLNGHPGPQKSEKLDHIILSHSHQDHVGSYTELIKEDPSLRGWATIETIELFKLSALERVTRNRRNGRELLFDESDVYRAVESLSPVEIDSIIDLGKVKIRFDRAGHTLGAVSLNFEFENNNYYITNDISFNESQNNIVVPAPKIRLDNCKLLVRESTYINYRPTEVRERTEERFAEDCLRVLRRGGRVIVPSLSDRIPQVFSILWQSGIGYEYPIYVRGAYKVIELFKKYSERTSDLMKNASRFQDQYEIKNFMRSGEPAVIVGTSGMLYPDTPSADWVMECLPDRRSAVFMVNYQGSDGQGQVLLNSKMNDFIVFNESLIVRNCEIGQYNLSAHMDAVEGEELEERFQPEKIAYVHGEDSEITKYLESKSGDSRFVRIKTHVGQEVEL